MTIAYVLNTYPQPSHSFIRRELTALEGAGTPVTRVAMRRPTMPLADPLDKAEEARTHYVLERGGLQLLTALLGAMLRAPFGFTRALALAFRMGRAAGGGRLRHLIYLAEAAYTARHCRAAGVQHIHAHFGTNAAAVALLVQALGGPGYSFTVHGPEEFDAPAALSLGDKIARSDFTVAISSYGRSQLCRWVGDTHWPRIRQVHCGIDPATFDDVTPVKDGPLRLVSIGRFSEQKGQLVLIAAMAELVRRHPDARLHLVGDGEMRPQIEAAIAAHDLGSTVVLTGWLPEAGIRAELDAAHALIMPSFAEGLPMVIIEAMAMGRPVIATYVAGIPELVVPGKTGWLVPAGDSAALAAAADRLAEAGADQLTLMGQAGRARALERHDIHCEAAKLAAFFQQAIGTKSSD